MADLQKIVDDLSTLTVLEAAELAKLLEEKWGVSAAAAVAVAAAPGAGGAEAKDLVEGAPKPVKEGVNKEEAEKVKATLEKVGAKVELK
jgi:large subunit ribosomal protein L7/L12